jgi:hypothetical protein
VGVTEGAEPDRGYAPASRRADAIRHLATAGAQAVYPGREVCEEVRQPNHAKLLALTDRSSQLKF